MRCSQSRDKQTFGFLSRIGFINPSRRPLILLLLTLVIGFSLVIFTNQAFAQTGSVVINSDNQFTNSTSAILNLSVQDFVVTEMSFSNDGVIYSPWEIFTPIKLWDLSTGDGLKTVYVRYRDLAATEITASDSITVDTTPPTGSVSINNGAQYATSADVLLNLSSAIDPGPDSSGIDKVIISEDPEFLLATWQDYLTFVPYTLSLNQGGKRVYVNFKDKAGNVSGAISDV